MPTHIEWFQGSGLFGGAGGFVGSRTSGEKETSVFFFPASHEMARSGCCGVRTALLISVGAAAGSIFLHTLLTITLLCLHWRMCHGGGSEGSQARFDID